MSGKTALWGLGALILAAAVAGGFWLVRRLTPAASPPPARTLPPLVITRGHLLRFTFVDAGGALQTVPSIDDVPAASREIVKVIDPRVRRTPRTATLVYVADLRQPAPDGTYPCQVMTERRFRELALPQSSEADFRLVYEPEPERPAPVTSRAHRRPRRSAARSGPPAPILVRGPDTPAPAALPAAAAPAGGVTLYATSWCGACARARAYLRSRGIAFVERDIEKDREAAQEYARVCASHGVRPGRVPGIAAGGRLVVGFSPSQMAYLLGR